MKEAEKESKGTEYYKGYAAGYRDAMRDFGYIFHTPLQIPSMKEWWDSPPIKWNSPICTSTYRTNTETQQINSKENK